MHKYSEESPDRGGEWGDVEADKQGIQDIVDDKSVSCVYIWERNIEGSG